MSDASNSPWHLYAVSGWGSAIAEALLTLAGQPYVREELQLYGEGPLPDRDRLLAINPLGQIPTIRLPDGAILTETAAVALLLADRAPGLAPPADAPERAAFLRWLIFLVAAIYPTFTYGDDPERWAPSAGKELRVSTDAARKAQWQQVEGEAVGPWFLGERFSAIDVYIGVMVHWRPGRKWFVEACPRLLEIADAIKAMPELAAIFAANFE